MEHPDVRDPRTSAAADPSPGPARRRRRTRDLRRPAVALLTLASLVVAGCAADGDADEPDLDAAPPAGAGEAPTSGPTQEAQRVDVATLGYTRGDTAAPVRVIEMSDFGCGYCRQFHVETFPTLDEEYVEAGKVRWQMIPFELGIFPHGQEAAVAGECAGRQDGFEAVRGALFDRQRAWKSAGSASDARDVFVGIARDAGLDADAFRRCLEEDAAAEKVGQATALARQLGVRGTPTFFVIGHGVIPGAVPLDAFRQVLDTAVARASRGAGP